MWSRGAGATFEPMKTGGRPRRLGLEVRFDADPIEGRLYDRENDGRLDRPFSGWLGLMSAIEAAREDGAPDRRWEKGETW